MAVKIESKYEKDFLSDRSLEDSFRYLSALDTAVGSNFPGLEKFEKLEPQVYRWVFENFGQGGYNVQIELVTRFTEEPLKKISLQSVPGKGNGTAHGGWTLEAQGDKTRVTFAITMGLDLPIPFFLKSVASSLASKGLDSVFDRYITNVGKALRA